MFQSVVSLQLACKATNHLQYKTSLPQNLVTYSHICLIQIHCLNIVVMSAGKKVAVVTGSNKGIGFAIVKELCSKFEGDVYLTSRDEGRGKAAVEELNKLGFHPHYHQLDIDDESSVLRLKDYLKSKYDGLDVLVNNAAVAFKSAATEPFSEQATVTMRTNFFNTYKFCDKIFHILKPHARVVNVSSSAGHLLKIPGDNDVAVALRKKLSSPDLTCEELIKLIEEFVKAAQTGNHQELGWPNSAYATSKIGISALTRIQQKAFDKDSREDIVVNAVHPGYVDTDMTSHKGPLTIEQGAVAPTWLALLPPNIEGPKGGYVWYDKQIVDWVNGPTPTTV